MRAAQGRMDPSAEGLEEGADFAFCIATFESSAGNIRTISQVVPVWGVNHAWVDGVCAEDPVLIAVDALTGAQVLPSAMSFFAERCDLVAQLAANEDFADISPTVLARAVLGMEMGANAPDALREALALSWLLERNHSDSRAISSPSVKF